MLKMDLAEIANTKIRDKKAKVYSRKIAKKRKKIDFAVSILLGILFGLIFGICHAFSVSACVGSTFTKSEWVDICYIARIVEAEAGNQTELGKRLVADTVLNRVKSDDFANEVKVILEEENQYTKGKMATEDTIRIVMEEYVKVTNEEVLYFRTKHYHNFGTPLFQEDDHYFSK